jgi:hypothetical protein
VSAVHREDAHGPGTTGGTGSPVAADALPATRAQDRAQQRAAKDAVARVWSQRDGARGALDIAYLVYVVVVAVLVLGVPALRSAGIFLARPDVLPVISAPAAGGVLTGALLLGAGLLVLLGAGRGPAVLPPFFVTTLASSHRPRRTALLRPFARTGAALAATCLALGGVLGWVLVVGGMTGAAGAVGLGLGALGTGLLLQGAWLCGQIASAPARRILAAVLALAGLAAGLAAVLGGPSVQALLDIAALHPGPGGAESGPTVPALVLLAAGVLVLGLCVPALDRVRGRVLLEQARRWEAAVTTARSSDLAGAAGTYRTLPSAGRRLRAVVGGGAGRAALVALYARRDLVALLRTPERLVVGSLGVLGASALLVLARSLAGPLALFALVLGALVLWSASGVFVDGIRHGIETLGAPRLFGQSVRAQVLLHAVCPLLVLLVLAAVGSGAAVLLLGGAAPEAAVLAPALVPLLVIGRARDAAKGPMPLALTTPIPTPQGDGSILPIVAWQADALLLALGCAGLLLLALGASWAWAAVAWAAAGALLALDAVRRVRELSRGGR